MCYSVPTAFFLRSLQRISVLIVCRPRRISAKSAEGHGAYNDGVPLNNRPIGPKQIAPESIPNGLIVSMI